MNGNDIENTEKKKLLQIYKSNWYWFVCSLIICFCLSVVYLIWAPKVYLRTATVMIQGEDYVLNGEFAGANQALLNLKNTVSNELSVMQSNRLMAETVRRLHLDMSYAIKGGLRTIELYNRTPVSLYFPDIKEHQSYTVKVKLLPNKKVQLWDFEMNGEKDKNMIIIQLNETMNTPFGTLVVAPTSWYEERWSESTIIVKKSTIESAINHFHNAVAITLVDDQSSVIQLSIRDVSVPRAEDILNTLIAVYVEESADYKKQIAAHTDRFINERIFQLEQGVDVEKSGELQTGEEYPVKSQAVIQLQHQYTMANYIKSYLNNPAKSAELLPAVGIEELGIERHISFYNQQLLKRNMMAQNMGDNIQTVQELNHSLSVLRGNIVKMIDNLQVGLEAQIREKIAEEQLAQNRVAQQETLKDVPEFVNQQNIKEGLYQYLLQKREENALNKAVMEHSIRHIDDAYGPPYPVAPIGWLVLLIAVLTSVLIPGVLLVFFYRVSVRQAPDDAGN